MANLTHASPGIFTGPVHRQQAMPPWLAAFDAAVHDAATEAAFHVESARWSRGGVSPAGMLWRLEQHGNDSVRAAFVFLDVHAMGSPPHHCPFTGPERISFKIQPVKRVTTREGQDQYVAGTYHDILIGSQRSHQPFEELSAAIVAATELADSRAVIQAEGLA